MTDLDLLQTMEAYLLGTLTDRERDAVEARLLCDTEYCQKIAEVENDLYDRYAAGEMKPSERKLFAARIAAMPDGARRVRAAAALKTLKNPRIRNGAFATAGWYAAACLALALAALLWWASRRPLPQPAALAPPQSPLSQPVLPQPSETARVVALDVPAVITRGASPPAVRLPAASPLRLRLELREVPTGRITVSVRKAGATLWSGNAGPAANGIAEVWIPPGILDSGEYDAVLDGAGSPQIFVFRVIRTP